MNPIDTLSKNWQRVGGGAGIIFVILFIIGIGLQNDVPGHDKPVSEISKWFVDNGERYIIGDYLIGLGFIIFFLPFLGALRTTLAKADPEGIGWARNAYAGGLLLLILGGAGSIAQGGLAYAIGVADGLDESAVSPLIFMSFYAFSWLFPLSMLALTLPTSLILWQGSGLWKGLSGLGLAVAAASTIIPLMLFDSDPEGVVGIIGFITFIAFGVWVLGVSIAIFTEQDLSSD